MVEIISAALFIFLYHLDGLSGIFFAHAFFVSALVVIFFIDLEFQIIPDVITLPGMFIGLAAAIFLDSPGLVNSLLGLVVGGLTLLGVGALGEWLFRKEAMGGGDIKMAAMMGAFVGWQKVLLIFVAGAAIGMVVSMVWMIFSPKVRRGGLIPFGPFLAMAAMIVLIYGERIIRYYVETFLLT